MNTADTRETLVAKLAWAGTQLDAGSESLADLRARLVTLEAEGMHAAANALRKQIEARTTDAV
ncbi:hypothetical protein [Falsiphaeobacter marinintestinus]|uniref:hypothetical protein n=1 Tax=Falsiphaeobacter marinintestinus TaxID=1492905 RepID=UPI0011B627C6|nr:hypothetical protein [Phaeobacter marinintestinus]